MPKILRIVNRFNLGGPTYNAAYLSRYLAPEFETLLIGGFREPSEESSEFILKDLGVDYKILPGMRRSLSLFPDYAVYRKINKIIKEFKPDIVHTHAAKAGALGRLAAWRQHVPVIIHTFHGHVLDAYFGKTKSFIFREIERQLGRISTCIITLSNEQKNDIVHRFKICPGNKAVVIPLGFDLSRFQENNEEKRKNFRAEFKLQDQDIAIGIIGRLTAVKNHGLFLEAVKYVADHSSKSIKAFIIGDGEEKEHIENLAGLKSIPFTSSAENLNTSLLIFTSWIKDIDRVIAGLDIIVCTSINEGTPVSLIEAQAGGKAIVTTRVGGIEDVVIPGKSAVLAGLEDKKTLCAGLLKLVEDEELRASMGVEGRNFAGERFDYKRLVFDTAALYRRLLSVKGREYTVENFATGI